MLLRVLAALSLLLLAYEVRTLWVAVLGPLLANAAALQTDFHYYYDAAQRFALDRERLYNPADDVIAGFTYPPLAILPFMLLARLPLGAALLALTLVSYAAVLAALWMWRSHVRGSGCRVTAEAAALVTLIAVASGPVYSNAVFGQVNALVLLSCVAFVSLSARFPVAAGVVLAAGAWLKIYPAVMAWIASWSRRHVTAVAAAAAGAVLLLVLALPIVPLSAHLDFVTQVLPSRIDKTAIHISNQSAVAFLERFAAPPSRYLYWTGEQAVAVRAPVRIAGAAVAALALLGLWWRARAAGQGERLADEASLIAVVSVIAPLGWGHTYVLALPLLVLRLVQLPRMTPAARLVTAAAAVAFMVPASRVLPLDVLPSWLQNVVYSRYLLATIALAILPVRVR